MITALWFDWTAFGSERLSAVRKRPITHGLLGQMECSVREVDK